MIIYKTILPTYLLYAFFISWELILILQYLWIYVLQVLVRTWRSINSGLRCWTAGQGLQIIALVRGKSQLWVLIMIVGVKQFQDHF